MSNQYQKPTPLLFGLLALLIFSACLMTRQLHFWTQWSLIVCVVINAILWAVIPIQFLNFFKISRLLFLDTAYIGAFIALDGALQTIPILLGASVLGSLVYLISNRYLAGLGGRLGTQAFITCSILIGISTCLSLI